MKKLSILIMFLLAFTAYCIKQNNSSETNRLSAGASLNSIIGGQVGNSPSRRIVTGGNGNAKQAEKKGPAGQILDIPISYRCPRTVSSGSASRLFSQDSSTTLSLGEASLTVDSGLLERDSILSISRLEKGQLPSIPSDLVNVTPGEGGYRFLPHGIRFRGEAILTMPYDSVLIPNGYEARDIRTYYYDEKRQQWQALPLTCVNETESYVESRTTHFTDMINGLLKTPENPEGNIFVPTQIKDLKAADPTAGITRMKEPEANQRGSLSLSYPISLPQGRQGLTPAVTLSYGSTVRGGWAGHGWSVSISSISIDTRWGVPRYDPAKESESYTLEGEALYPDARTATPEPRTQGVKQYWLRREGRFARIERHGDSPLDYTWTVTDKNGTTSYYGTSEDSYLGSPSGRGEWLLSRTVDANGNSISYTYRKKQGQFGSQELVLSSINYTGHDGAKGAYTVTFTGLEGRPDATTDGRLGFLKQSNSELLTQISVSYEEQEIRRYELSHKEGPFYAQLLTSIREVDASGQTIGEHTLDYYDDLGKSGLNNMFGKGERVDLSCPRLTPGMLVLKDDDAYTSISGSRSSGFSVGGSVGAGLCSLGTVNGNYDHTRSEGEGAITMIDIDGDGLTDKVTWYDGNLWYRKNNGDLTFAEKRQLTGVSESFSSTKSNSDTWGVSVSLGSGALLTGGIGWSKTDSKTRIKNYFSDFNGDGLMDLAIGGSVYFNSLENGVPTFSKALKGVLPGAAVSSDIYPDAKEEEKQQAERYPMNDAVRVWQAPFSGKVTINAPVSLRSFPSDTAYAQTARKDGVKLMIQVRGDEKWRQTIASDDHREYRPSLGVISVDKGDRIYFRVNSVYNGSYDRVQWSPDITYTAFQDTTIKPSDRDENGRRYGYYSASQDFLLAGEGGFLMPETGDINLTSIISSSPLSDTLHLTVTERDSSGGKDTLIVRAYLPNQPISDDQSIASLHLEAGDSLSFSLTAASDISFEKVHYTPRITYVDAKGKTQTGYPTVDHDLYTPLAVANGYAIHDSVLSVSIQPQSGSLPAQHGYSLSVKSSSGHISNLCHAANDRTVPSDSIGAGNLQVSKDSLTRLPFVTGKLYVSVLSDNWPSSFRAADCLCKVTSRVLRIVYDSARKSQDTAVINVTEEVPLSVYAPCSNSDMGFFYHGWGQFSYNANGGRSERPMAESDLKVDDSNSDKLRNMDPAKLTDKESMDGLTSPTDQLLTPMNPSGNMNAYVGADTSVSLTAYGQSSGRIGLQDVYVEPYVIGGAAGELDAPVKLAEEETNSFFGNASILDGSYTTTHSHQIVEAMDLNGDRYPDIVSEGSAQFTNPMGQRGGKEAISTFKINNMSAEAYGFGENPAVPISKIFNKKTESSTPNADKASHSASLYGSISGGESSDSQESSYLDLNGDGLPDRINDSGEVAFNIGYGFTDYAKMENYKVVESSSGTVSGSVGGSGSIGKDEMAGWKNLKNNKGSSNKSFSVNLGAGLTMTTTSTKTIYQDLNGDGLPDRIDPHTSMESGAPSVYINTGTKFVETSYSDMTVPLRSTGCSMGESANVGASFSFCVWLVKVSVSISGGIQHGVSSSSELISDIDGDGYPDAIFSSDKDDMTVCRSRIGNTNLLRKVTMPLRQSMEFGYSLRKPTQDDPDSHRLLSSVATFDGHRGDGDDSTLTTYSYGRSYYDREERESYGFDSVTSTTLNADHSVHHQVRQAYDNRTYAGSGDLLCSEARTGTGRLMARTTSEYTLGYPVEGTVRCCFSAKTVEETRAYNLSGDSSRFMLSREDYTYDKYGRVTSIAETGNSAKGRTAKVAYHSLTGAYIMDNPREVTLYAADGSVVRHHTMEVDAKGNVTRVSQLYTNAKGQAVQTDIDQTYDEYGNVSSVTLPPNDNGQRVSCRMEYDAGLHQYVSRRTDQSGFTFSAIYDPRWGTCLSQTDDNGSQMLYNYDSRGRIAQVTAPKEIKSGAPYTMRFSYGQASDYAYSMTEHYRTDYPDSPLRTVAFVDGQDRVLQIKNDISVFQDAGSADKRMLSVSGKEVYDRFDNVLEEYLPGSEEPGSETVLSDLGSPYAPTRTTYDVLDRKTSVTLPDGATTLLEYSLDDAGGPVCLVTATTDPMGRVSRQFTDSKQHTLRTIRYNAGRPITTTTEYDEAGQLLKVTDTDGNTTTYTYDQMGNKLSVDHPDAGLTTFEYDRAGNVTAKQTPVIRAFGADARISYTYDYDRLTEVDYPVNTWHKVQFSYGDRGASGFRGDRLSLVQDASGGTEYFYDEMGNITKTIRTILISQSDMRTFVSETEFDTWGRTMRVTYPDGEVVSYSYTQSGLLSGMSGTKRGRTYDLISRQGYDDRGQRVYRRYGNGAEQTLAYDPLRSRLTVSRLSSGGQTRLDNSYTYDKVDNILGITNAAAVPAEGLGGSYAHRYTYDDLNRLISASGTAEARGEEHRYSLGMEYDDRYNILAKRQAHILNGDTVAASSCSLRYAYEGERPNQATSVGSREVYYDADGNLTLWQDTTTGAYRQMVWDEEDRLVAVSSNGDSYAYTYDASGERVIKSHTDNSSVFVNGKFMGSIQHGSDFTVYVSPMMTYTGERFTKHYYAGSERVASRMGTGSFANKFSAANPVLTAGNQNYVSRMAALNAAEVENPASSLALPPGPATNKGVYARMAAEGKIEAVETAADSAMGDAASYDIPRGWPRTPVFNPQGDAPGAPIKFRELTPDSVHAGYTFVQGSSMVELDQYFYHGDHISSTVCVTDRLGRIVQSLVYLPFGETMLDEASISPAMPYKFSGKEQDTETGMSYFGARYYDPMMAMWMGVDPMTEEQPGMSGYVYCGENPILLKDEDGNVFGIDNVAGAGIGIVLEIGNQMIVNGFSNPNARIDWRKVAIAGAEGFLTSGTSSTMRAVGTIGSAIANSVLDHHKDGTKAVILGTANNLFTNCVGGAGGHVVGKK